VNMPPAVDPHSDNGSFPVARRGYDREAVDHFVRATQTQIAQLVEQYDSLITYNHQLRQALDEAHARASHADFSGLGARVQEILHIAEEQATDITQGAIQEADRLSAQRQAEIDELRQSAYADLAEMRDAQRAELDALREQVERDTAQLREHARTEAEQLVASARLQAGAVRTEAEAAATGTRKAASFESQELLAAAERDSAALRQKAADQREHVMAELKEAQESANQAIQAMLAEATELQRAADERLTSEAERAAKLRNEALAEAERIKVGAGGDADEIIDRARHHAAVIDDRVRQELALRRRQMQDEQDLLMRRKHAMLNQLASVGALAVETAENLPDVPETDFSELAAYGASSEPGSPVAEIESDPTVGNPTSEAGDESGHDVAEETEQQAANEDPEARAEDEESGPSPRDEEGEPRAEDHGDLSSDNGDEASRSDEVKGKMPTGDREYAQSTKP
jgi:cell division septum initiation protein DivIVA